jgi:hypothetical protein
MMGHPEIDFFASRISHQLDKYFSWKADPDCVAVDAFRQNWGHSFPYAFNPFCLITRVLRQMVAQSVEKMILIAPMWPSQPWYPLIREMCIQVPVLLPNTQDLLSNPSGQKLPLLQDPFLSLAAWLVSGIDSRARGF